VNAQQAHTVLLCKRFCHQHVETFLGKETHCVGVGSTATRRPCLISSTRLSPQLHTVHLSYGCCTHDLSIRVELQRCTEAVHMQMTTYTPDHSVNRQCAMMYICLFCAAARGVETHACALQTQVCTSAETQSYSQASTAARVGTRAHCTDKC
jgi:hypothetical protein